MMSERQRDESGKTDRQKYRQGDRESEENKRHRQRGRTRAIQSGITN